MPAAKISIQIITYNGMKYLPTCLDSLKKQSFKDFSVLILDNNSKDNSVDFVKNNYPEYKIIENKENFGFAKAHNQGIRLTQSEYVLCLNQDMFLDKNFLMEVVNFLNATPEAGSVTGKIYRWDFESDKKTNSIDSLGLEIQKTFKISDIAQGEEDGQIYSSNKEIFGVSGAAPIYRRKALEDIKLKEDYFDQDFFMYKEDVDLAFRLHSAGWKSYMLADAKAFHDRTIKSDKKFIKNRKERSSLGNYYSYKNHLFVLLKNIELSLFLRYFLYIISYEIIKLGYIIVFEWKTLPAALDFLKNFAKICSKRKGIREKRMIKPKEIYRWIR